MESIPTVGRATEPKPTTDTVSEASRQHEFERLETQQYQLVLPAKYEQLRGYLANDGLLSDEEITRCLYDETLRRADLAKRIEERTPTAQETDRKKITEYLWTVHQTVKGLPLTFVNPKKTYRIDVVDTPAASVGSVVNNQTAGKVNQPSVTSPVSPVTLHLDINGGFLANFLHNAQLNHEQMNRFIADLERQHRSLTAQLNPVDLPMPVSQDRPVADSRQENLYQLLQESGPSSTASISMQPPSQSINNQTQEIAMNETSVPGAEAPVAGRPTRYQWAEVAHQFEKVGITHQDLEKTGHFDDLLNGRKSGLMKLTQTGEEGKPFQVSGKLYIVNTPDKGPMVGIQPERKQLLLPKEFLGYELTARDKQNLEKTGEMGKRIELTDKMSGNKFAGYVGVDKETKSLTVLRAERLHIPQTVKGVTLTKQQQKNLEQGRAIKLDGMTSNNGQTFNAYVQVSAAKRSLTFARIPDNAVRQTVDQKTAQDLTKPVHQLKGDGAGGKKTIQPREEAKQATAQRVDSPKPVKQQKSTAPKPAVEENKPKRAKKQKGPRVG